MKRHLDNAAIIYVLWIALFVLLWEQEFIVGTPSVAVIGGEAYLNWTISNLARDTSRFIRNPADNASLMIFFNDKLTPDIIEKRATFTGDLSQGSVSFTLSNISLSDAGKYTFTLTTGNDTLILGGQVLVVVVCPNIQHITSLSLTAVVGTEYVLNCSSESRSIPHNHNLTMHSEWKTNGVNISIESGYSVTGTILTINNISRKDNGKNVTCRTFEDQRRISAESDAFVLNILYGPDAGNIIFYPNQTMYELVELSPLIVNCSADCYPDCQYGWTGPWVGSNGNTGVLSIPEIKRNQTGRFTCTATNPNITSKFTTATISVTVFYGPDTPLQFIPSNTNYIIVEGALMPNITCSSSCFPSCEFHWTGPVMSPTGVISLGQVNRSISGNYTCRGKNPKTHTQTDSSVVTVIVIYGPDTPVLRPSSKDYILNESNILPNISCFTECFPSCTYFWYKEQTKVLGNQDYILSLGDVYRNDSGNFTCRTRNVVSNATGETVIHLVVQYPPTIRIESRNGSFIDTELMINCSAHGMPQRYNYSLIHRSLFSGINIRQLFDNEPVSTGALVHWFRNPSFMDTGVYTCIARNGIPDYRDGSLDKNISETVWIRGPPIVTSRDIDFYAEKGESVRLVIEFYNSLLDASVTWNKERNQTLEKLEISDKYNISVDDTMVRVTFYSHLIQQPGFITTLEIKHVMEDDFCAYHVHLQNSAGTLSDLTLNLRSRETKQNGIINKEADEVIIGGAIGGSILLLIAAAVAGIILYRRRSVNQNHSNGAPSELEERSAEINIRESELVDNPLYETAIAEYAAVVKPKKKAALIMDPSNLYAQVSRKRKVHRKGDICENRQQGGTGTNTQSESEDARRAKTERSDDNVYETSGALPSNGLLVNKDRLLYADLMLDDPSTKNGKVVIHGIENRTEYAEIAHGKKGEPLPDSNEEIIDGSAKVKGV